MTSPSDKPVFCFTVSVSDSQDPPIVSCSPPTTTIATADTMIEFNLVTAGYSFDPATPIVFSQETTDFPYLWPVNATQVMMNDLCSVAANLSFTIKVIENGSGRSLSHDPIIRNEPT